MDAPAPRAPPAAFRRGGEALGVLDTDVAARVIAAAGDITLLLDEHGIVRDISIGDSELEGADIDGWIDRPLLDQVTSESRGKVTEMLAEARGGAEPRWRQVNHARAGGGGEAQLPVRYLAIRTGAGVVAIGRDMRAEARLQQRLLKAQQSMERDYMRLRQAESRYRLLFDVSREPVLIVDLASRRITDANPAAVALAGRRDPSLTGQTVTSLFAERDRETVVALMAAAARNEEAPAADVAVGPDAVRVQVSATVFRQDRGTHCLLRLAPLASSAGADEPSLLADVLERMPDGFALVDDGFRILSANAAFLDLVEAGTLQQVTGQPIDSWLGRPGIDLELLVTQLKEHGAARNFATILRGRLGGEEEVELSAIAVERQGGTLYGFAIRPVARRLFDAQEADSAMPRSVEQLTELVGRVSLKEIVRESTDLIERLCIEAALNFTSNNRASAAELLGLSRQSLYSKLRRHGLGNLAIDFD